MMIYLTEGLVRATSDKGLSAQLAWGEVALCTIAFVGILLYTRRPKNKANEAPKPETTSSTAT
jgi:uncharacterized membrane protein